jgi:NADH-quinone oxidoreductase subunit M
MFQSSQIPFLLVVLPLVGAILVIATARHGLEHIRRLVLTNVIVTLALAIVMVACYDPDRVDAEGNPQLLQMVTSLPWAGSVDSTGRPAGRAPDIRFTLAVDGLSLWLIALTAVLMVPSVLVSWEAIRDRAAAYYALLLVLESGLIGVFAAQDIILFYVFFEFTLIPLFFLVGIWGGYDRRHAARKFFIYTLAGSVLTFLGLLAIVLSYSWMAGEREPSLTFSIPRLTAGITAQLAEDSRAQEFWSSVSPWIFLALFAGFAIKVPLFPFHTWLPLAHVEAPTAGSVLLAGVLLKIGSYGFLRFALPLVPDVCWRAFDFVAVLSVAGIIYGAFVSLAQEDIKKLIAYSSVSHMGFCLLGLFALNSVGIAGGLLQMINHGLTTGALFAIVGMLYERYHTRDIEAYSGMARRYPVMAFCLVVLVLASIGLPGLNGFTGEILALLGMFREEPRYAILALSGIILGAWYMLWLVQRTFFGKLREPILERPRHSTISQHEHAPLRDLNRREILALAPVLVLVVWIGVYPQFFLRRMQPSIDQVTAGLDAAFRRVATAGLNRPHRAYGEGSRSRTAPRASLSRGVAERG